MSNQHGDFFLASFCCYSYTTLDRNSCEKCKRTDACDVLEDVVLVLANMWIGYASYLDPIPNSLDNTITNGNVDINEHIFFFLNGVWNVICTYNMLLLVSSVCLMWIIIFLESCWLNVNPTTSSRVETTGVLARVYLFWQFLRKAWRYQKVNQKS